MLRGVVDLVYDGTQWQVIGNAPITFKDWTVS
jgi:hypothetical protein